MNLPNKLTIFRILLVPIMVIIPFFQIKGVVIGIPINCWLINLIFIIASITDKLDGYLARKNNQVTTFGKFLDQLVSGYRLVAVEKGGKVIAASNWGKLKTVTQMIAIILAFVDKNAFGTCFMGTLQGGVFLFNLIVTGMMIIQTIATIFSGIDYMKGAKDLIKD